MQVITLAYWYCGYFITNTVEPQYTGTLNIANKYGLAPVWRDPEPKL
jgi:hypothetical protein